MFYMSHVIIHMNGLKDIKCLRVWGHFHYFYRLLWSKYPLRKVISALAFQHLHSFPLQRPNTSSINCLLSDITSRHTYMHVRSQSYSNCCISTEVAIGPLITCDLIKHLYLFPVSIFSKGKKTCRWQFRNTTTCTIICIYLRSDIILNHFPW